MGKKGLLLALISVLLLTFWKYYDDNYRYDTAYAVVKENPKAKRHIWRDEKNHQEVSYTFKYKFHFVLNNGEERDINYYLVKDKPVPLKMGKIVKAGINKEYVISKLQGVAGGHLPDNVKQKLE
ncbi:DUF1093 domain-containing protein [Pediococcus acidilactici]|uniref:DUF1093 domain-containing protein n=1 Tax=Pediococcus acidilactici TaxID=1254 RepID=UPI001BD69817|nr:DUF1093 domain-containing protein [Pediococcus acidilactici]MBS9398401.1 DUF1093 domain-containing protein [Pediococcus acidilactici]